MQRYMTECRKKPYRMDDIIELIIYLAIGVAGLLLSAYRSKQKRKARAQRASGDTISGQMQDVQPDLGPLAEIFGIPRSTFPKEAEIHHDDRSALEEEGFVVEEEGFMMDTPSAGTMQTVSEEEQEATSALETGMEGVAAFKATEDILISDSVQDSAIDDTEGIYESIRSSEIKGADEAEQGQENDKFDWRKAVIYSEILQRRGN